MREGFIFKWRDNEDSGFDGGLSKKKKKKITRCGAQGNLWYTSTTGLKNINIDFMECLVVVMECIYNDDALKKLALTCYIANKLFGQQWLFGKVEESNKTDIETDNDSEELAHVMKIEKKLIKKWWKEIGHLDFFTNKEVNKKVVVEFSLICYKHMASYHDSLGNENVMFNELGYCWTMKLKYNTHIILVTDNAIDKLFRDTETLIGSSKPKPEGAVFVFFHPKKQDLVSWLDCSCKTFISFL